MVQIEDTATLAIRSYVTQADGTFHFSGLRRNTDYEVSAKVSGGRSDTQTVSKFNSRDVVDVVLRIQLEEH